MPTGRTKQQTPRPGAVSRFAGGLAAFILLAGAGYLWTQRDLFVKAGAQVKTTAAQATTASSSKSTNSVPGDVPQNVMATIESAASTIPGLNELVIEPTAPSGYTVAATFEIASGTSAETLQSDIGNYLEAVYGTHCDVQDAQVYAMSNGRIVAGAGLGASAYKRITSAAGVTQFSLVSVLQRASHQTSGPNDEWYSSELGT